MSGTLQQFAPIAARESKTNSGAQAARKYLIAKSQRPLNRGARR